MRVRFFLIILGLLLVVSIVVSIVYAALIHSEKLALVDQQLRETASALIDSQLGDLRQFNLEQVEDIISEELGESRIGKFFIVRNSKGSVIYESSTAKILPVKVIPQGSRWVTISTPENFVRVLNLQLPRFPDRTLQVGLVMRHEIIEVSLFSKSHFILLVSIVGVGLLASLLSSRFLLTPIAALGNFVFESTEKIKTELTLDPVPQDIGGKLYLKSSFLNKNDEYQKLIKGFNALIGKVNRLSKNSRYWAYQMAHELKTPLTLIGLEVESLGRDLKRGADSPEIASIQSELRRMSDTISSFLNWAEIENSSRGKNLFANRMSVILKETLERFVQHGELVEIEVLEDFVVFCSPLHLEQLVVNLMTNSFKYGEASREKKIWISIGNRSLVIKDQGPGVPESILNRLGEPFNKGTEKQGSGLGLAWVSSICRLYDWQFQLTNQLSGGTIAKVTFTEIPELS